MRELIFSVTPDDCELQTFRAGGKGGQNQNARDTGVRWVHRPSGAVGEARDERHQAANKRTAWERMANSPKMRLWIQQRYYELTQRKAVDELVNEAMDPANLRIEVRDADGRWK